MILDQELASLELVGIHAVQQHSFPRLFAQVFAIEFGRHWTPNLGALHVGNVTFRGKVHPVGFVKFRADQKVEVVNLVVFTDERRCESELGVRFDRCHDTPEHGGWNDVHFVQQHKAPLARRQEIHHFLRVVRSFLSVGYHRISRYDDASIALELVRDRVSIWGKRERGEN